MSEILVDFEGGCSPAPESYVSWEEARAASPPLPPPSPPQRTASAPPPMSTEDILRLKVERLEKELEASRKATEAWCTAASSLFNVLLLSPTQLQLLSANVSKLLEKTLCSLSFVEELRYVDCSFPAAGSNAPQVELLHWRSVEDSEWSFSWAPSWSCEVGVDGRQFVGFSTLLRIERARLAGRLRVKFAADHGKVSICFAEMPEFHMEVTCNVTLGTLPLPIQAQLASRVQEEARKWISNNLVHPKSYKMTVNNRKTELSDADVARATKAAMIGAARARSAGNQRMFRGDPSEAPPTK